MNIRPKLNSITERVLTLRDAGVVKRSHTCRTLMDRNVAEHSHGVAMLVLALYERIGYTPSAALLAAALVHDLSEIATGDVPAPVKRHNPDLKRMLNELSTKWEHDMGVRYEIDAEEQHILLWCDRMDFALYALEEVTMGNRFFDEYLIRITEWLAEMPAPVVCGDTTPATELYEGVTAAVRHVLYDRLYRGILA